MARKPVPGSDKGSWGSILNDFLSQSLDAQGDLKDGIVSSAKLAPAVQTAMDAAVTELVLDKQWVIAGPINVAAGDVDFIAPAYLSVPAGRTATITTVRARINSGTNV